MVEIQRHGGYIAVSRNVAMSRMHRMSRPADVCVAASRGYRGVANRLRGSSMPCNDGAHPVDEPTGGMPAYLPKVLVGVLLACALVFGWSVYSPDTAQSATPRHTVTYSVQQGDTLWQYAQQVTPPGGDVRGTVRDIVELNHLQSTELMPGQTIVVPVDR